MSDQNWSEVVQVLLRLSLHREPATHLRFECPAARLEREAKIREEELVVLRLEKLVFDLAFAPQVRLGEAELAHLVAKPVARSLRSRTPVAFAETAVAQPVNRTAVEAIFAVPENGSLATAGCALRYADGDVECIGKPGPVGALLPNGRRFDLALPFGFPFSEIVKRAQK